MGGSQYVSIYIILQYIYLKSTERGYEIKIMQVSSMLLKFNLCHDSLSNVRMREKKNVLNKSFII